MYSIGLDLAQKCRKSAGLMLRKKQVGEIFHAAVGDLVSAQPTPLSINRRASMEVNS